MKKIISFALLALFLISMNSLAFAESKLKSIFTDINTRWASEDIHFVAENGLMAGYPDHTFKPNKHINRLELAVALDRTFDFNFNAITFIKQPELKDMFDDVDDGKWYSTPLLHTTFFGVLNTEDRMFKPNELATRIEIAQAIQQSFEAKNLGVIMTQIFPMYDDTQTLTPEASSALSFVFNTGIMKGRDDHAFAPNKPLTRAELASVLRRTLKTLEIAEPVINREIEKPPLPKTF